MDVYSFYDLLLPDLGLDRQEDDSLVDLMGKPREVLGEAKPLVFPSKERQKSGDDSVILFHPLSQNILRNYSPVLNTVKQCMTERLYFATISALVSLGELVLDTDRHAMLTPSQAKFLTGLTDYKKRTHTNLKQLIKNSDQNSVDKAFIRLFLKKGGTVNDTAYSQAAIVSFPIRERLDSGALKLEETTFKAKKDVEAVKALFDYVLPDYQNYSQGSSLGTAPALDAMLKVLYHMGRQLNKVYDLFENVIPKFEEAKFNLEWFDCRDNFKKLAASIPPQPGNTGDSTEVEKTRAEAKERAAEQADEDQPRNGTVRPKLAKEDDWQRARNQLGLGGGFGNREGGNRDRDRGGWGSRNGFNFGNQGNRGYVPRAQQIANSNPRNRFNRRQEEPAWTQFTNEPAREERMRSSILGSRWGK